MLCWFVQDTATTVVYTYCHTLSLHDARPILVLRVVALVLVERQLDGIGIEVEILAEHVQAGGQPPAVVDVIVAPGLQPAGVAALGVVELQQDRKSTRLNSSH